GLAQIGEDPGRGIDDDAVGHVKSWGISIPGGSGDAPLGSNHEPRRLTSAGYPYAVIPAKAGIHHRAGAAISEVAWRRCIFPTVPGTAWWIPASAGPIGTTEGRKSRPW